MADPVRESAAVVQELLAELEGLRREARQDAGPVATGRAVGLGEAMDLIRLRLAGYRLAGPGEVVVSAERLRAADDVAAVFGWCPAGEDSEREKAAVMLWRRWSDLAGSSPDDHPHLTDEYLAGLAAERDAIKTRLRAGLARLVSVEPATSPTEPTEAGNG